MNGLKIQWGNFFPKVTRKILTIPIAYSSDSSYSFVNGCANGDNNGADTEGFSLVDGINKKTLNSVDLSIADKIRCINWLTIGY